MTEAELIERCRTGNRDAQHELYVRTVERVQGVLRRIARDDDLAADLLQQTYLRAFTALVNFDGRAALSTWLYRIAVNTAFEHLRRTRPATIDPTQADARALADDGRAASDARLDLDGVLRRLSAEDRAILVLRYQKGLDYATIAEVCGVAVGTVGARLSRARERLRVLLGENPGPPHDRPAAAHPTDRDATAVGWETDAECEE